MAFERPIVRESGRWYRRDGRPVNEILSADGKRMIRPSVIHARKYGFLPSVTSIIRILDKPGLRSWRDEQVILAALSMPRKPEQTDEQWVEAILKDAQKQVETAADKGKDWHGVIENALLGRMPLQPTEVELNVIKACGDWLLQELGEGYTVVVERSVVGEGWCGTPDIVAQDRDLTKTLLCDIKTVDDESDLLGKEKPYKEWLYQIAPYWRATDADDANCWELILGRESGKIRFHRWPAEEVRGKGWRGFSLLRQFWAVDNDYDPISWVSPKQEEPKQKEA